MVKRGTELPKKLKNDAIIEALFELRFETNTISEIFFGRVADHPNWKDWKQRTLPAHNIPAQIRSMDPNLQFSPTIELVQDATKTVLRIGPQVMSYHRQAPYIGWEKFKPELDRVTATLFETVRDVVVKRLGLRYLNSLRPNLHGISGLTDLDLAMTVSGEAVAKTANLNFITQLDHNSVCKVVVATPEFVLGLLPPDTSVYVDVDVYTKDGFKTDDKNRVNNWVEFAHTQEKSEFFRLFNQATMDRLKEG